LISANLREAKGQGRTIHDNGPEFSGMIPSVERLD
jgi:hypothetical protein